MIAPYDTTLFKIATFSLALLVLSVGLNVLQSFTPKDITGNCNSFGSYVDILISYHRGNRGLDGDNDGMPCENRK